jgi:hypothetical protein
LELFSAFISMVQITEWNQKWLLVNMKLKSSKSFGGIKMIVNYKKKNY